jgi:hypothetical protein
MAITHTDLGPSPTPDVFEYVENQIESSTQQKEAFLRYVDTAPNHNAEHQEVIDFVGSQFAQDGLEVAPIVVLDGDNFKKACEASGRPAGEKNYGRYTMGRSLVEDEPRPGFKETFGNDYTVGIALHESAHSTAPDTGDIVTSKAVVERGIGGTALGATRYFHHIAGLSGFHRYKWEGNEAKTVGNYWEEAFCDLTRVRYLERTGREPKADGEEKVFAERGVRYAGEGVKAPVIDKENDLVTLPMKFSLCARSEEGSEPDVLFSQPGIAAYGLELLDERAPGLFETMQSSRKEPSKQREVIKMINNVQPGLYKQLRDLPYSDEGFEEGLRTIVHALEPRADNVEE